MHGEEIGWKLKWIWSIRDIRIVRQNKIKQKQKKKNYVKE